MFGRKGDLYGEFCAASLKMIKALALQGPASGSGVVVPDVDHVYPNTFKALVDFHEGNYLFPSPEQYGILAQQVMAADILGDDSFIQFIATHLQVPTTCLDVSHTTQEVRMTVRDRLRIRSIVPCLQVASHMMCFQCKGKFLDEENRAVVLCCGRTFHCSCLVYVHSCPYCTVAWGGYDVLNVERTRYPIRTKSCTSPSSGDEPAEWFAVGWMSTPGARNLQLFVQDVVCHRVTTRQRFL